MSGRECATETPDISISQPLWQDDSCLLENGNQPMKYSFTWLNNTAGVSRKRHINNAADVSSRFFTQAVKPLPPLNQLACARACRTSHPQRDSLPQQTVRSEERRVSEVARRSKSSRIDVLLSAFAFMLFASASQSPPPPPPPPRLLGVRELSG